MIGKSILHYKILAKLGEGGMGIVYKAEDTKLNREVAIKVLPPHLLVSEDDRARFNREAKAAAALNHANIATVYEINEQDGKPFIVMEYVPGQTLNHHIEKGPFKLEDAISITIQIADGLRAAHAKDIVHRDIKSSNVLLGPENQAKILDFGLAKTSMSTKLTQMGTTIGTVAYMSPEQIKGNEVGHRTDLWSLGVVLYEMISGRLPYSAEYDQAIFYAIQNEEPEPLTALRSGVPMSLEWIVAKLMAKEPNERYQSASDLIIDLKAVDLKANGMSRISSTTQSQNITKTLPKKIAAGPSLLPWIISGVSLLTVIFIFFLWAPWSSSEKSAMAVYFDARLPKDELIDITVYSSVAISPDGSKIVFRSNNQLFLRNINQLETIPLAGTTRGSSPFFSPDGRWLGFFAEGKLKKLSLGGGSPVTLANAGDNRGGTWGKNGVIVFSASTTFALNQISDAGGVVKQPTTLIEENKERTHRWPNFLPDGKTVLFTVGSQDSPDYYEEADIDVVNIETGARKNILKNASSAKYIETGHLVYSQKGILYAVEFDIDNLEITGSPINVVENLNGDATSGAMHYAISENGTLAYIPGLSEGDNRSIIKIGFDGSVEKLAAPDQAYTEPRISADGKKLAIVIGSGKDFDIWIYEFASNNFTRLTFGGVNRTPNWSPDGQSIAYYNNINGEASIKIKKADGSGDVKTVITGQNRLYIDGWTPDGQTFIIDVYFGSDQSGFSTLNINDNKGLQTYINTPADEYMGELSPDGKWLAYISNESGPYEVFAQPFPKKGGKWQISMNGGMEPRWAADGKMLYYTNGNKIIQVPISITGGVLKKGKEEVIFEGYSALPVDSGISYDVSPIAEYFITTQPSSISSFQQVNVIVNWFSELQTFLQSEKRN